MKEKNVKKLLKKVVNDYDNISDEFSNTRQREWKEFETMLPYLKKDQFLVDLGCGNGRFYKFIKEKKSLKYLGIDNSRNLLKQAQKAHPEAEFIHGDLLELPLDDKTIDVAAAIASIHHIPSKQLREKVIQEIHRTLKDKDIFIITVWNLYQKKYKKYIWKSFFRWLFSFRQFEFGDTFIPWGKSGVKRYYYAFKEKELENLLKNNKFKILKKDIGNNFLYICQKTD
jgi:ubiquinone/menaquinone biosynthesis C-methylase UbiE